MPAITIDSLYRYPIKGFSPERLDSTPVLPRQTLPNDRAYAVENGPSGFDPAAPSWFPKQKFLCWMKNPKVAALKSRYDDATGVLTIAGDTGTVSGDLATEEGRAAVEAFLSAFMAEDARGPLRVLSTPGHSFSDVAAKVVSFINPASAADLGASLGAEVDPIRFRGNVHLAGLDPWVEATWIGRHAAIGPDARVKFVKSIQRCLATHVDPDRGVRDLDIMGTIRRSRGDLDCGVYAEVRVAGTIRPGDELRFLD
jgi:uncharacterized protein YcbX